jgi:hypothetical protein
MGVGNVSVDPDADAIGRLLLLVESNAHRHGWDGMPSLMVIYDATDADTTAHYREHLPSRWGMTARLRGYAAAPCVPPGALDGVASHGLFRLALNIQSGEHSELRARLLADLRAPGFVGMALVAEGWSQRADKVDAARAAYGDRSFADMPGSEEMRFVACADVAGTDYRVLRFRGSAPGLDTTPNGSHGAVAESLRVIVAVIAGLPVPAMSTLPSGWDWDAEQRKAEAWRSP